MGRDAGPNFHTWAVWGSRKAGVTIRQEDLESAVSNATITAGVVGSVVGAIAGFAIGRRFDYKRDLRTPTLGAFVGTLAGGSTGRQIAIWSRAKAAKLILEGNRIVLRDIGEQSAAFLQLLEMGATSDARERFFLGLRGGATEHQGQERLATAFRSYLEAFDSKDLQAKRSAMIQGNCEIVFHEHLRLEPYIRDAMPFIIRRCATERMMTFDIGDRSLAVGEDLPGTASPTAARDWTKIEDRMRYIFALFREFHDAPEVFGEPFKSGQR